MDAYLFEAAMDTYGNTVLRAAISITGNKADAEDVFCDVFLMLFKYNAQFHSAEHMKAWLLRVTINKAKNVKKSAWAKKRTELNENIAAAECTCDTDLFFAMQKLKKIDRTIIFLHYYEGYALKEIASMLDMREGSIRSRASRARATLKEYLSD